MFNQDAALSDTLVLTLEGNIDTNNSAEFGRNIAKQCAEHPHKSLVLDARKLKYISSSGLRVLVKLTREEEAKENEKVTIIEVSREVYDIFDMTGFTELFNVKKAYRNVSIDGCKIIGKGAWGTVYRLDNDKIVKVYSGENSIRMIKREQQMAKKAFLKGVPTPISYDVVRVGDDYGSVFELLNSKSFNDRVVDLFADEQIGEEQKHTALEELLKLYVECIKNVHNTEFGAGELEMAKNTFIDYLRDFEVLIPTDLLRWLNGLLQGVPDDYHLVHGDLQMRNVMLCENEPMLIDMETISTGQPIFDLQALFVTYKLFPEDEPGNSMAFLGIGNDTCDYIWKRVMELYYETDDWVSLKQAEDRIRVLASVRFLHILRSIGIENSPLGALRFKHTLEHLRELSERVDRLV